MAGAPHKQGLDFFSFDVTTFNENDVQELLEVHKAEGFIFFLQIRCAILSKSNYLEWNKFEKRDFRKKHEYSPAQIEIYLNFLLDTNMLSRHMFDTYNILTSDDIQGRYVLATKERSKVIFIKEYMLINFDDFRHLKQIIHIYSRDGELLERFSKKGGVKINPETGQPIKKGSTKAATPIEKPAAAPQPAPEKAKPSYTEFTFKDVNAFIRAPYEKQDEVFKETYSKYEYEAYVRLNKVINSKYEQVRKSNRQLTFPEYIEFIYESPEIPTPAELEAAFKYMATLRINKETDIYRALEECLQKIRVQHPPGDPPEQVAAPYQVDEKFELSILEFWGLTPTVHHKKYALIRAFCTVMNTNGLLDEFKRQFPFYKEYKELKGITFRHNLDTFLGNQSELFADSKWDSENWEQLLIAEKTKIRNKNGSSNRKVADPEKGYGKP